MPDKTRTLYATRDFTDAGTGKSFAAGKPVEAEAGQLANYAAVKLVSDKRPARAAPTA